jgi:hypothetical protein
MNDEKPSEPRVDGRPFDGGVGPTTQATTEGVLGGRVQLSASQVRGDTTTPSWKAPAEKRGFSTGALIALLVVLVIVLLVALRIAGVF